jgi:hypothetical protein
MLEGVTLWLETLQKLFGSEVVGWVVLILSPFIFLYLLLWLIQAIIEIVKTKFIPLFYNSEEKRKIRLRKRFAEHIESEIRRLNQREDWNDFRFAELEAEVEMEGERRSFSFLPFIKRTSSGLRREKSLSRALKQSQERIILVEGDPGSGKSVALRHVALDGAKTAKKSKNLKSIIPVYLNLKELKRQEDQPINRKLIEDFILKSLKRVNDRDVNKFVDDEFYSGLENGSWFFLFDSFDEIPDVLGAEDADKIIREYADAIYDFLHGLNSCRGVVASRYFKGPGQVEWPRFKIINLTRDRQIKLVKLSELETHHEKVLLGNLDIAIPEIQRLAENPLFLGLLVGYVQNNQDFPQHVDSVFGAYIKHRLSQDKDRVYTRFRLDSEEVHLTSEKIAFCMSESNKLGLSPTRKGIKEAIAELEIEINDLDNSLDALEFMKLGRSDNSDISGDQRIFTFSHRRFQEYFATLYVLREQKVTTKELLTNPRWRETAVVICQTQPEEHVLPLVKEVQTVWSSYVNEIYPTLETIASNKVQNYPINFPWPHGCLYLLDLLQDGFSNRKNLLPIEFLDSVGALLGLVTVAGSLPNRIWALEVAGISSSETILEMLHPAIEEKSHFLSDLAYKQASKLDNIPSDIKSWIKKAILKKMLRLGILKGGNIIYAQVSRLADSKNYISVIKAIQFGFWIDILNSIVISVLLIFLTFTFPIIGNQTMLNELLFVASFLTGIFSIFLPWIWYDGERLDSFYMTRFMYTVLIIRLFLPAVFVYKINILYGLVPFYFFLIFPLVIAAVDDTKFEKSYLFTILSPFIFIHKLILKIFNGLNQVKNVTFPKQFITPLFIIMGVAFSLCSIMVVSEVVYDSRVGGDFVLTVAFLALVYIIYLNFSKIFAVDIKFRKAWKKWADSKKDEVGIEEIIRILPVISTRHAYQLFSKIREEKLFPYTKENLHFLSELIRLVENPYIDNEFSASLKEFLMGVHENKLKSMLLDELFKSIEEMKYKLQ